MNAVGTAIPRIDGPLKVSGTASYASDYHFPGMLYAVPIGSTIAKGRIEKIDTKDAEKMPGVRAIFHRENLSKIFRTAPDTDFTAYMDEHRPPFEDDVIRYHGQYVALAVADTFEQAQASAHAVKVTYRTEKPNVEEKMEVEGQPKVVSERGEAAKAFDSASIKIDHVYTTPSETHSAIELHATVAVWEGDRLTLYETSQGVVNHKNVLQQQLGVGEEKVRVISKFLGSGFGGKLFPWPYSPLAAAAARDLNRPVKLVLSRQSVFQTVGHRPSTQQRVRLSASPDGKLTSFQHDYVNHTAMIDDYEENCGEASSYLYSVPNLKVTGGLTKRNVGNPTSMRGPGAVPGLYATETAMDELAIALKIDPLQLRIINEPKLDEGLNIPFSSRHMLECYSLGAEKFGWSKRNPAIGSMTRDGLTLGWGVAACAWIAERFPAEATVDMRDDGTVRVACGTQDIGTGTYTMLAMITAQRLGIPVEKIEVVLGDTTLPPGPLNGGSMATGSVIPAVFQAADGAIQKLLLSAVSAKGTEFSGKKPDELAFTEGRIHLKNKAASSGMPFGAALAGARVKAASGRGKAGGTFGGKPEVSRHSYGVHFVEVTWDEAIARLRVNRIVTVIDAGKIVNPMTARNQIEGSVVMGIGMGLFEETLYDHRNGAPINRNFADYVMATNADVPRVDVHFLDYPDKALNEIGARGVGEIGLAGIASALSNAVHHATGVRVRDLPISIEDLLSKSL
ncbi:xanthine dehydrogenase family protein molybdopterin-binding subunit [bacterium]|nr:MAG: xanthine dehydrogenase family protein molybdopterin-binding subunit [bacterium]